MARAVRTATLVALLILTGCAAWERVRQDAPDRTGTSTAEWRDDQRAQALLGLSTLEEVARADVLLRLNNDRLRRHMLSVLREHADQSALTLSGIDVAFGRQLVRLTARLDPGGDSGASLEMSGDIRMSFSGDHLIWLPRFARGQWAAPARDGSSPGSPSAAEIQSLVDRANREITDPLIIMGRHTVRLAPVPLGTLVVGAETGGFPALSGERRHALGGVFTVAGSAILIEPQVTSVALDLEFVPNISVCDSELKIGRAGFATEIRNREPVGLSRSIDADARVRHFFTEVQGARGDTAVVHLWFADGQPVAVEELHVGPSARWRTWSTKRIDEDGVRHWEVIVVERDTGCILHSHAIQVEPERLRFDAAGGSADAWDDYRHAFAQHLSGFLSVERAPEFAQLEIRRDFLARVFQRSLENVQLDVELGIDDGARRFAARLEPFDPAAVACAERDCTVQRSCAPAVSRCIRQYDTRDCTTCLFRNPLNNRCVNEVEDPICLAAQTAQNDIYERLRQQCVEEERAARTACERLRAQETESCRLESDSALERCEAARAVLEQRAPADPLALVTGELRAGGRILARHSGFEVREDFSTFAVSIDLRSQMTFEGTMHFRPPSDGNALAECIAAWQGPFRAPLQLPQMPYRYVGRPELQPADIVTEWSGVTLGGQIGPSPIEALFIDRPVLLADCQIGLRAADVSAALAGADAALLRGQVSLELRPLPSTISLAKSMLEMNGSRYEAAPRIRGTQVIYETYEAVERGP